MWPVKEIQLKGFGSWKNRYLKLSSYEIAKNKAIDACAAELKRRASVENICKTIDDFTGTKHVGNARLAAAISKHLTEGIE